MARTLALALLTFCGPSFASDRPAPFLEQKQFVSRSSALSSAAFLAGGKFLATASLAPDSQGTIQLWNAQTGVPAECLPGHTGGVYSLVASPGGKYLACGGDGQVAIYDALTRKENSRIAAPVGRVLALAFSPDAALLAVAGEGKQIHFLDVSSRKLLESLTAHEEAITSLVFAPDGKRLFSGSYDGTVKIWEIPGRKLLDKLVANGGRIHGLAISSDGKFLAAACAGNPEGEATYPEVALWNFENGKQRKSLRDGAMPFTGVQFSSSGSLLAAAKADGWVMTWTLDGHPCSRLQAHRSRVTSLSFSPDGNHLITTAWEPEARLWDLPRWKASVALAGEFVNPNSLVYNARTGELIVGGMEKVLHVVDPEGKKPPRQLQLKAESTQTLAVSSDGRFLASSGGRTEAVPGRPIRAARFGMALPPVVKPELITLWDLESGKELRTLGGHQGLIGALAFSSDALLLASGSADKTIRLWDVAQGIEKMQLIGHASPIASLAFRSGGKYLASGSQDGAVRIWDLKTGHEERVFQAHPNGLNGLAYSPDGRFLATSAGGHGAAAIALWDAETAENRWLLPSHSAYLGDVTFSPDGRLVLAAGGFTSEPGLIRIIDTACGRPRLDLLGGKAHLASMCFAPDGKSLFTAGLSSSDKGKLLHWSLPGVEAP